MYTLINYNNNNYYYFFDFDQEKKQKKNPEKQKFKATQEIDRIRLTLLVTDSKDRKNVLLGFLEIFALNKFASSPSGPVKQNKT